MRHPDRSATASDHAFMTDPGPVVDSYIRSGIKLITFDVFDTLLWRTTLYPENAFLLLSESFEQPVAYLRAQSERIASVVCRKLLKREPTLSDIYRLLPFNRENELAIEAHVSRANPFCLNLVRTIKNRNIAIAAISDMYLSANQISNLLQNVGFPEISVFSSASEHVTKYRDGRLYERVWSHFNISADETLHIGDNLFADIQMAQRLGAHTCYLKTPRRTLLELLPMLDRPMKNAAEAVYWGQLALLLHELLPYSNNTPEFTKKTLNKLAEIHTAAETIKPWPLDTAFSAIRSSLAGSS